MTPGDLKRYEQALRYRLAIEDARDHLIDFTTFTNPHPQHPHDPKRSTYLPARHHEIMADLMESIARREILKALILAPVRHGKSALCSQSFPAWYAGRNPLDEVMLATYGEKFAHDFRKKVADIMRSLRFRQAFPEYEVVQEATDQITNHLGRNVFFLGRKSPTTGRGADVVMVDDPLKDAAEAASQVVRDSTWEWLTQTLLTRRHTDKAPFLMTTSRWHEDDPAGRILDKSNPKYSREFSDGFVVVRLPALAEDDDPLGRQPGEALWPERFKAHYLEQMRALNPVAFTAIYQCDPTPAEGVFFQQTDLHTYDRGEMPEGLRWHAASDHAVSTAAMNDRTCMGVFGVAQDGTAYIHPDLVWGRIKSDEAVEQMIRLMRQHKPLWWYAERGHISRAIGPFLQKRMQEEGVHCPIMEDHPTQDALQRAQSARARCAQGRILFPAYAEWWPRAKDELIRFPNARHDDFVAFLSIIGMKLGSHIGGFVKKAAAAPAPGTWGALKAEFSRADREDKAKKARAGW